MWNSFLLREAAMKAECDDPRPEAPADIFNLFPLYNVVLYTMEALVFIHGLCIGWFLRVVSLVIGAQVPKLVL